MCSWWSMHAQCYDACIDALKDQVVAMESLHLFSSAVLVQVKQAPGGPVAHTRKSYKHNPLAYTFLTNGKLHVYISHTCIYVARALTGVLRSRPLLRT